MIEKITISSKYYPVVVQLKEKNIISLKDMILRLVAGNSIAFYNFVAQDFPSAKISFVTQSRNSFLFLQPRFSYFDFVFREYIYYYDNITKPIRELYFIKNDFMNYDFFAKFFNLDYTGFSSKDFIVFALLKVIDYSLENFGVISKNLFMEFFQDYCSLINPKLLDLFFYIGNLKYDNGNYYIVDNLMLKKLKSINLDLRGLVDLIENFNKSEISTKFNIDEVMFYIVVKNFVCCKSSDFFEVVFLKIC